MNYKDGEAHTAVLYAHPDSGAEYRAEVIWDPKAKHADGRIGAWQLVSTDFPGEGVKVREKVDHLVDDDLEFVK